MVTEQASRPQPGVQRGDAPAPPDQVMWPDDSSHAVRVPGRIFEGTSICPLHGWRLVVASGILRRFRGLKKYCVRCFVFTFSHTTISMGAGE